MLYRKCIGYCADINKKLGYKETYIFMYPVDNKLWYNIIKCISTTYHK